MLSGVEVCSNYMGFSTNLEAVSALKAGGNLELLRGLSYILIKHNFL